MNICFYSPYLPKHFGGGEKHLLDVVMALVTKHTVKIAINDFDGAADSLEKIKESYSTYFGYSLENVEFITTPIGTSASLTEKLLWTRQFDALYYVTDGSLFFSLAKHNYLHIQTPLLLKKNNLIERLKLQNWHHKNANSEFTKLAIERSWATTINDVINPMVDLSEFPETQTKKKQILSVGRFFTQLHSKRQDVLIDIFIKLLTTYPKELKGWELVLAGSVEDREYLAELQKQSKNYPIIIRTNVTRTELVSLYSAASIYWHAAGYGVNELTHPEKVEHFGISVVEAMAGGAIPLVHYKGGPKEILGDEFKDLGWLSETECIDKTLFYCTNKAERESLQPLLRNRARLFDKPAFNTKVQKLFV